MSILKIHETGDRTSSGSDASRVDRVCDERFVQQLKEVQGLKRFLFEEKVKFDPTQLDSIDLGSLNNLRFARHGRVPTSEEWKRLDEKISILSAYLTEELRQKIRIRELSIFFGTVPLIFLVASLIMLLFRFSYGGIFEKNSLAFNTSYLLSLMVWTVAQGGLGACAFLGTKVTTKRLEKISLDALADTTDVTDKSILKTRIILGCLFASLGIPFAAMGLDKIALAVYPSDEKILNVSDFSLSDFSLIVLPFMVGYSTNLVLAIFERVIDSIRTFFGIGAK